MSQLRVQQLRVQLLNYRYVPLTHHLFIFLYIFLYHLTLVAQVVKTLPAMQETIYNAGDDVGSIPGSGRSPGEGHGNPLWYSCLGNPMDFLLTSWLVLFEEASCHVGEAHSVRN